MSEHTHTMTDLDLMGAINKLSLRLEIQDADLARLREKVARLERLVDVADYDGIDREREDTP